MDRSIVRCVKLNQQTYQLTSVLHPHLIASDIHRFYEIFTIHSFKIFHIYIEKKLIITQIDGFLLGFSGGFMIFHGFFPALTALTVATGLGEAGRAGVFWPIGTSPRDRGAILSEIYRHLNWDVYLEIMGIYRH